MNENTKKENSCIERLINGIFKENPTFVLLLGMCPTLAVTSSAKNGLGMGLSTLVVLALSNLIISLLRKIIPNKIRIPAFIVIIASFVTIVEMLLKAYLPSLNDALGIYIKLIVVNCIILGRAESYAYSHKPLPSLFDGIGMGLGFTMALTIIGALRELLGEGTIFEFAMMPDDYVPISIMTMAPGAFFILAILTAIQNSIKDFGMKRGIDVSRIQSGCGGNCLTCDKECKTDFIPQNNSENVKEESDNTESIAIFKDESIDKEKKKNSEQPVIDNSEKLTEPDNKQKKEIENNVEENKTIIKSENASKESVESDETVNSNSEMKESDTIDKPSEETRKSFEKNKNKNSNKSKNRNNNKPQNNNQNNKTAHNFDSNNPNNDIGESLADDALDIINDFHDVKPEDYVASIIASKKESKIKDDIKESETGKNTTQSDVSLKESLSDKDTELDDSFEILDLQASDSSKDTSAKSSQRRKKNVNKAKMLLSKAEETLNDSNKSKD